MLTINRTVTISTSAGMGALWITEAFAQVQALEQWEHIFATDESIRTVMEKGVFVPLNVGGDGVFQVTVRSGDLTPREAELRIAVSDRYLLQGPGALSVGGVEEVGSFGGGGVELGQIDQAAEVIVSLIDWKAGTEHDNAEALSDFVVQLFPASDGPFSRSVVTFPRP